MLSALQEEPVDGGAGAVSQTLPAPQQELPLAGRLMLLWLELVAVGGAAFLLLQVAWVAGTVASSVWSTVVPGSDRIASWVVAKVSEAAAVVFGLLSLAGWVFSRPWDSIARTLFAARRIRAAVFFLYSIVHIAAFALVSAAGASPLPESVTGTHGLISWQGTERLLTTLLAAPVTEELFFRGLMFQVVLNRSRSAGATAAVTSVLFALLHLANARRLGAEHFTVGYIALQSAWALLVGVFLSLQVSTSGSLAESALLHAINNLFAMQMVNKMQLEVDATVRILIGMWLRPLYHCWPVSSS